MPAGTYHFVLDSIILAAVDVKFELIHRRGMMNTVLVTWDQHFEPPVPQLFEAVPYEVDQTAPAIDFKTGDKLVFRFSATNTIMSDSWIPNGDGANSNGRIPSIRLPK